MASRDENWKKLRQYVLDERERIEVNGPGGARLWGERRDYTWFIRDGLFIRSPLAVNGVRISEEDRRAAEDAYLKRARAREKKVPAQASDGDAGTPATVGALLAESRRPEFIDSAYFLNFKFEPGHYALVGRETFDGRSVLRIEYYPTRLFTDDPDERKGRTEARKPNGDAVGAEVERMMNKVSLVTLWVAPDVHQNRQVHLR